MSYARFLGAVHPDDRECTDRAVRACLESGGQTDYDIEFRTLWPDGSCAGFTRRETPILGWEAGMDGRHRTDVTARKQDEEALQIFPASRRIVAAANMDMRGRWPLRLPQPAVGPLHRQERGRTTGLRLAGATASRRPGECRGAVAGCKLRLDFR
jgi:PAS fold